MSNAYKTLFPAAKELIRDSGLTIAAYVRDRWPDGQWYGDACGCTDDRCIGYHHDETEECQCLPVLIRDVLRSGCSAVSTTARAIVLTSPGPDRKLDHWEAQCQRCGWRSGVTYSNRTLEGCSNAMMDAVYHNARHHGR